MISELFLEGYRLDVSDNISSLLTFAIDDVKDFASRSTTFSKTVVLPGTGRNNDLFGNIFDLGSANEYDDSLINLSYNFNAAKSAKCVLYQDNLQTFKGTLRLLQINVDHGRVEYEVALNGDLTTLNVALSSGLLENLDFSEYDQPLDPLYISASWSNIGKKVYFPLIDYGNASTDKHHWHFKTFRPALFVKEYIDKMFLAAGFKYDCALFSTDRFKRLIIPHNQKQLLTRVNKILDASVTTSQKMINLDEDNEGGTYSQKQVLWDKFAGGGFTQALGYFTYNVPQSLQVAVVWHLSGLYLCAPNDITQPPDRYGFTIYIQKNGVELAHRHFDGKRVMSRYEYADSVVTNINKDDVFDFLYVADFPAIHEMDVFIDTGVIPDTSRFEIKSPTPSLQPVGLRQQITMNDALPQNVRQVDFLSGIVKLFNLYVTENEFDDRLIEIKPFIDFYDPKTTKTVDWTGKVNRNEVIQIKPMSELNSKLYQFTYSSDSDFYNDLYNKRYNQIYGSYIYDTEFEFADQTNKLQTVFAPTPLVGYLGEDKVYSTIFKRSGDVVGMGEDSVDSVIRILQTKKVMGVEKWKILFSPDTKDTLGEYTYYGYAGHFDDPDAPSNDLNFGALKELFFVLAAGALNNTQFNVYWSGYMAEITDKDSKLLTAKLHLTPKDIFDLNFARLIVVDGVLFRLNKITDYNATLPSDCQVELLKVIRNSYTLVNVPPIVDPDNYLEVIQDGEPVVDFDGQRIKYLPS